MNCKNCNQELSETSLKCDKCVTLLENTAQTEYYSISLKRMLFFSIVTLGLFKPYWFYKNWKAIKQAENSKIIPLIRALFSVFFCYSFFKRVDKSAKHFGYSNYFSPIVLTLVYVILVIIANFIPLPEESSNSSLLSSPLSFSLFIAGSLSIIPLLLVQKASNYNNEKIHGKSILQKRFSTKSKIVVTIFLMIYFLLCTSPKVIEMITGFESADKFLHAFSHENSAPIEGNINPTPLTQLINSTPANKIKRDLALPRKINDTTWLVDVSTDTDSIIYHYEISGIEHITEADPTFAKYLSADVCEETIKIQNTTQQKIKYKLTIKGTTEFVISAFPEDKCMELLVVGR